MSDKVLNDLLSAMDFSSPSRQTDDEESTTRSSILKKNPSDKIIKRVLIPEGSLTPSGNLMDIHGKESLEMYETSSIKLDPK